MANKVRIMGILNVTPDSFSDGGKFFDVKIAVAQAKKLIKEGADIIDVGGESSGPGSQDVSLKEELRRVIPVIKRIAPFAKKAGIKISIDTYKAEVARQAIKTGAGVINDVTALRGDSEMASVAAKAGVPIVLMYSKDPTARTTRIKKNYKDVVKTVMEFLKERAEFAVKSGIKKSQIILDPGMGAFVSSEPKYSYEILRRLREFKVLGFPVLIGTSRKSFLPGKLNARLIPSLIANLVATKNGAGILRVHDVAPNKSLLQAELKLG